MTWILAPSLRRSKKMSLAPEAALRTTRPARLTTSSDSCAVSQKGRQVGTRDAVKVCKRSGAAQARC